MKLKYIFFILFSILLQANEQDDRRNDYIEVLDQEINEMIRLSKSIGQSNPTIFVRMMYNLIEKAKLEKEKENDKFLRIPPKKRQRINKQIFFKTSKKIFKKSKEIAEFGVRKFPNYSGISYFFHGLSEISLEMGMKRTFQENLKKVFKFSKKGSDIYKKSSVTLAEYYFNKKMYNKSISYYKKGLEGKKNKWWTKDAYNLSWCYLLTNDTKRALNLLKKVYHLSKNPKFIDNSYIAERELAYFYVIAGRFSDAMKFYKSTGGNLGEKLVRVAEYLKKKGKYTAAEKLMNEGLLNIQSDKDKTDLESKILNIYSKYGKHRKHFKVSRKLFRKFKNGALDEYQLENFKNELKLVVGNTQKKVLSKRYRKNKPFVRRMLFQTIKYFEMLALIESGKYHEWTFLAGETYFAKGEYNKAIRYYEKILISLDKSKKNKYFKKSLEGFLASLKKSKFSDKKKESLTLFGLKNIILIEPKSKRSDLAHQRLFSLYLKKKKINDCEDLLLNYKENFRWSHKVQEEMINKLMSYYKKKGDKKSLYFWALKIKNKEFKVSDLSFKKANIILLSLKFRNVENQNIKGKKKEALSGYLKIYRDSKKDIEVKKNSAFNAAVIFFEGEDLKRSYYWSKKTIHLIKRKEMFRFENTFISISNELFNRRFLKESADLYFSTLKKVCFTKSKNKEMLLKNSGLIFLSIGDHKNSLQVVRWGERCNVKNEDMRFIKLETIKFFDEEKRFSDLELYLNKFSADKEIRPSLIYYYEKLRSYLSRSGRFEKSGKIKNKLISFYKDSQKRGEKVPLEGLEVISKIMKRGIIKKIILFNKRKFSFPESKFNKILKSKLKSLDDITSSCLKLMGFGSSFGIVNGYILLIETYNKFIEEISTFTPKGRAKEYINSFRGSMNRLTIPLKRRSEEFYKESKKKIIQNSILSEDNYKILLSPQSKLLNLKYFPLKNGILMDRGGIN